MNTAWARFWRLRWFIKWPIIAVVALIVIGMASGGSEPKPAGTSATSATSSATAAATTPAATAAPAKAERAVSFQTVETWRIPNGGSGRAIVIPASYLNDADMKAVGERLRADGAADRNSVVMIFTDEAVAKTRLAVLEGRATKAQQDAYDKAFIGTYTKNGNTGFHRLEVCYGGFVVQANCHSTSY